MKKIIVIAVILVLGYLVLDYLAGNYIDENLQKIDIGEAIIGSCGSNTECLNATRQYYPLCKPESKEMDANEYFKALEETVDCIHKKSGVDIYSLMEG